MADRELEGWAVPQRLPVITAVATLTFLVVVLLVAGSIYGRTIRLNHRRSTVSFPAPGIETFIHDGVEDPYRPKPPPPRRDPAIDAAKRAIASEGLPGWSAQR